MPSRERPSIEKLSKVNRRKQTHNQRKAYVTLSYANGSSAVIQEQ